MINNKVTQKIVKRTHPPGLEERRNPTVIKKSNKQKTTVIEPNGEK